MLSISFSWAAFFSSGAFHGFLGASCLSAPMVFVMLSRFSRMLLFLFGAFLGAVGVGAPTGSMVLLCASCFSVFLFLRQSQRRYRMHKRRVVREMAALLCNPFYESVQTNFK